MNEGPRSPVIFGPVVRQGLVLIAALLFFLAVLLALYSLRHILLFFFISVGIGVVIQPILPFLKDRFKIPQSLTAFLLLLLLLLLVGGGTFAISRIVVEEFGPLLAELPNHFNRAMAWLTNKLSGFPSAQKALQDLSVDLSGYMPQVTGSALSWIKFGGSTILHSLFVVAIALYTALDSQGYKKGVLAVLPERHRPKAALLMSETAKTLRRWVAAQGIIMLGVGAMTAVALLIIGMPDWPVYALMAAVLNIIPYVGPFVTAGILLIISLGTDPSLTLWILLAFTVIQEIESYVLTPMVMKGRIKLPPVYLLLLMFVMSHWFGLLGVFAASPVLAVLRRMVVLLHVPRMDRIT